MHSPVLKAVADLDPARSLRAPGDPRDPALEAILMSPRRRPVSRARTGALAGVGIAAAAAALVVVSPWSAPAAYATWTRVPSSVTSSVPAGLADECSPVTHWPGARGVVEVPVAPVLTEVRGDYTYVVQSGDGVWSECLATVGAEPGTWDVVQTAARLPADLAASAPTGDEVVTYELGTTSWASGEAGPGALTSAVGRAGADVERVEVALDDGTTAEASVEDGWWVVWAPGADAMTGRATLTLTDGTEEAVRLSAP